jgi:cytochrome c553
MSLRRPILVIALIAAGCGRDDMADQPRYKTLGKSEFFSDGQASRPIPPGTVARGQLRSDDLLFSGKIDGKDADVFPFAVNLDVISRGRERYNIYCAVCHGETGDGNGMIVQRGFTRPPSFHIDRLRAAPAGHYFDVITNGWGAMFSYNDRVKPEDRWAIAAYIRALQLSQYAEVADLPPGQRAKLEEVPR